MAASIKNPIMGISTEPYTIPDVVLGVRRPIKIIVIGFGFSGINISYVLGQQVNNSNITLQFYDKNPELGGTWFENTYPGCACDIPIVNYQFSWHPSTEWTSYYATQKEILSYLNHVVAYHSLDSNVRMNHLVSGAWWEEDKGRWRVRVQPNDNPSAAFFDHAEILINYTGALNNWKWPAIPGLDKFSRKMHTAAWDHSVDLVDQRVGVIGNGSSAVQITTATYQSIHANRFVQGADADDGKSQNTQPSSCVHQHGLPLVLPPSTQGMVVSTIPNVLEIHVPYIDTDETKRIWAEPERYLSYRKDIEREMDSNFAMLIKGTTEQLNAAKFARNDMIEKLEKKPELAKKLIPTQFSIGCRRPIPDNGYLEAITSNKCTVTFVGIVQITEQGFLTDDGRGGLDLRDAFKDPPETYLSVMAPDFPNYFMIVGPFGPYGHGSILPAIEAITRHLALVVEKFQTQNIKSLVPGKEAVAEFKQHRELYLKRTIWDAPCSSWFKLGPNGENIMMWPGNRLHCFDITLNPRWEDYDWVFLHGNRYSYWGNGFTPADTEAEGTDKAWYITGI